jgi:hypothetical protein
MELDDYRKDLIEEVKVAAQESRNFEASAFVDVGTRLLADAGELTDFETCHFRGTGSRRRHLAVDGFAFDDADGSVRVVVADWDGKNSAMTLTHSDAKAILGRARAFVEESIESKYYDNLENSSEGYALSKELHVKRADLSRCRIYLITDKVLSGKARDFPEGKVSSIPVEFHIWDIARFHRVAESMSGRDEVEIDLAGRIHGGIPCIAASVESDEYKAYLCVIRGDVLASIYDEFGSRLLEGNVRSFLSAKGKINKAIRATIRQEPHKFFAYNNGIAATATEVEVKANGDGLRLVKVKDLQIVNGGQTTASLALALREGGSALDTIFVQMKLSVIPVERAGEIIPWIARYANSQNKVSDADFFSNHDFHRRLEMLSRQVWAPAVGGSQRETHWFYERARGQFVNEQARMTKSEKARFLLQNPKKQVIAKTDVAKVENAWQRQPHVVCLGAQKNFIRFAESVEAEWNNSDADFNKDYFIRLVAKVILFNEVERLVPSQTWYQGGYRAQIVAYTIAKLADLIQKNAPNKELDLASIWSRQGVPETLKQALAKIAAEVHSVLVNPDSGYANVTEWSKREQCWKRVAAVDISLMSLLSNDLVDQKMTLSKETKQTQKEDRKIGAVLEVVNFGSKFWATLGAWGAARDIWTPDDTRLLALAARKTFVPLDRQAIHLLRLREKAIQEGYVRA